MQERGMGQHEILKSDTRQNLSSWSSHTPDKTAFLYPEQVRKGKDSLGQMEEPQVPVGTSHSHPRVPQPTQGTEQAAEGPGEKQGAPSQLQQLCLLERGPGLLENSKPGF